MMREWLMTFTSSFLFAVGLVVSGMNNPGNIIAFLDVTGDWNPSLAFVMVGAIATNIILFKFILKKPKPIIAKSFNLPENKKIDKKLIIGSAIFGIGWGITGICPGPAFVNFFSGHNKIFYYLVGMIIGMVFFEFFNSKFLAKTRELK